MPQIVKNPDFYILEANPALASPLAQEAVTLRNERRFIKILLPRIEGFEYQNQHYINVENHYSVYADKETSNEFTYNHLSCTFMLAKDQGNPAGQGCQLLKIRIYSCPRTQDFVGTITLQLTERNSAGAFVNTETLSTHPVTRREVSSIQQPLSLTVANIELAIHKRGRQYEELAETITKQAEQEVRRARHIHDIEAQLLALKPFLHPAYFEIRHAIIQKIIQPQVTLETPESKAAEAKPDSTAVTEDQPITRRAHQAKPKTKVIKALIAAAQRSCLLIQLDTEKTNTEKYHALCEFNRYYATQSDQLSQQANTDYIIKLENFVTSSTNNLIFNAARDGDTAFFRSHKALLRDTTLFTHIFLIAIYNRQPDILALCFELNQTQAYLAMVFGVRVDENSCQTLARYSCQTRKPERIQPLHVAISNENIEALRLFIQHGFPINIILQKGRRYFSLLDFAIEENCLGSARVLLESGICASKQYSMAFTSKTSNIQKPFMALPFEIRMFLVNSYSLAFIGNNLEALALLQEFGADPWFENITSADYGGQFSTGTPNLIVLLPDFPEEAIFSNPEFEAVTREIFQSMPVDDPENLNTALQIACLKGNFYFAKLFIELGAKQIAEANPATINLIPYPINDFASCDNIFKLVLGDISQQLTDQQQIAAREVFETICATNSTERGIIIAFLRILSLIAETNNYAEHPHHDLLDYFKVTAQAAMFRVIHHISDMQAFVHDEHQITQKCLTWYVKFSVAYCAFFSLADLLDCTDEHFNGALAIVLQACTYTDIANETRTFAINQFIKIYAEKLKPALQKAQCLNSLERIAKLDEFISKLQNFKDDPLTNYAKKYGALRIRQVVTDRPQSEAERVLGPLTGTKVTPG